LIDLQEVAGKYSESTLNPALATQRTTLDRQAPEKGLARGFWFIGFLTQAGFFYEPQNAES